MKNATTISVLALLIIPAIASGQDAAKPLPEAPSSQTISAGSRDSTVLGQTEADPPPSSAGIDPVAPRAPAVRAGINFEDRVHYYLTETYFNHPPSVQACAWRIPRAKVRLITLQSGGKGLKHLDETMEMRSPSGSAFRLRDLRRV